MGSFYYQVALQADEVHPHEERLARVAAQDFDALHEVGAELITPLQDTQNHNIAVSKVTHDVSGQPLCPATKTRSSENIISKMSEGVPQGYVLGPVPF